MLINSLAMSFYYIIGKKLTGIFHPNQVAFLCKFFILIAILPWCFWGGKIKKNLKTDKFLIHFIRAAFGGFATLCFFYATRSGIVLSNISAITFLEQIVVILIGIFYFREKITQAKLICVILSVIGCLFIIRPAPDNFSFGYVYIFLAIIFWAGNNTAIKILGRTERSRSQIFYMMLFSSLFLCPMAISEWKPIETEHYKYLFMLSALSLVHTASFFKSFKKSEMSLVMPFDYTRILFVSVLGYYFYNQSIDGMSVFGYGLIIVGGIVLIMSEYKRYNK